MSLSLEPDRVVAEVMAHTKSRDERLVGALDLIDRYPGPWWKDGPPGPESQFDPENAVFEYMSYAMSQLVWANPRWRSTTRRPRAQQMVAEAMGWGMNRWTVDSDFKTVLEDAAVDYSIAWGVLLVSPQPRPEAYEAEDPVLWPQVTRISPWDFGFDNRAPTWRRARMLWHRYRFDKEDLIKLARKDAKLPPEQRQGWILSAIEGLATAGHSNWGSKNRGEHEEGPDREEVELVEVYMPGRRLPKQPGPEQGFNGTILTLAMSRGGGAATYVKEPAPFFGPRWGPYTVLGNYIVPDSPYPLSLLLATAGHIEQSSRLAKAVDAQVEAYKRLILVGAQDQTLASTIKNGKSDHVYMARQIQNIDALVRAFEIGGTTPGNVAAEQRSINKRNRAMGMDEVQRGNVTGEGTATEVQLAVEASMGRQGFIKGRFQDGVRRVGKTVAWYLYHMDEIIFPLGEEALQALGLEDQEAWFKGGSYEDGTGTTFDDLGLELEPYSMERPSEAFLRQRGEFFTNIIQMAPALAMLNQMGADVKGIIDGYGDAYGMPRASGLFPGIESVDPSMIQPAEAAPKLSKDVGIQGLFKSFKPLMAPQGGQAGGGQPAPQDFSQGLAG